MPDRSDTPTKRPVDQFGSELPVLNNLGCFVAGTTVWLSAVPQESLVAAAVESLYGDSVFECRNEPALEQSEECWPIEAVPLGARVSSRNPRREDYDFSLPEPNQATWRRIFLRHQHSSGVKVDLELLRPAEWIDAHGLEVGQMLTTSMPDMQFAGQVIVLETGECPPIADGPGSVVTGRFVTEVAPALARVTYEDGTELTGTPWHPVWSADRTQWVGLADLANHHPLPKGRTFRDFLKERGFKNVEIEKFTRRLDVDVHQGMEKSGWWQERLFGEIAKREARLGKQSKDEIIDLVAELLDEVENWGH